MPKRKIARKASKKKPAAKAASLSLVQVRKRIDALKKKFERHAKKTVRAARSNDKRRDEGEQSKPAAVVARDEMQESAPVTKSLRLPGKRERARKVVLEKIAEARIELANRDVQPGRAGALTIDEARRSSRLAKAEVKTDSTIDRHTDDEWLEDL